MDEIDRVRRSIPMSAPQVKGKSIVIEGIHIKVPANLIFIDRGMVWGIKDAVFGQSKEHEEEDNAARRAHYAQVQKMQDEAMQQARSQRDYQRKLAADRLNQARDMEDKTALALNEAYNELDDSKYQLGEAKTNLEKAKGELELLSNKEIELVSLESSLS